MIDWDKLKENIFVRNTDGAIEYQSILLRIMTQVELDKILAICGENIYQDEEEGNEHIDWSQVKKEWEHR